MIFFSASVSIETYFDNKPVEHLLLPLLLICESDDREKVKTYPKKVFCQLLLKNNNNTRKDRLRLVTGLRLISFLVRR